MLALMLAVCAPATRSGHSPDRAECTEIWDFGLDGKRFLNLVSQARVAQIAASYSCTPLACFLLDAVFCGGLHPPGFKCHPTANAPQHLPADEVAEYPAWLCECLESWFEEEGVEGGQRTARTVDVMEAACVVSLGGAAKTHLLDFYFQVTKNLQAPQPLYVGQDPPLRREVGNFSALAIMARKHNKIVYCPDEWGLAVLPAKGPAPKGTSASQMVTMQVGLDYARLSFSDVCSCQELINFLTPAGGGMRGVSADRSQPQSVWPIRFAGLSQRDSRTFEHANGLATTLQRDRLHQYMFEDHSAATFRIRKALVPESVLFADAPDVKKATGPSASVGIPCSNHMIASAPENLSCRGSRLPSPVPQVPVCLGRALGPERGHGGR